MIICIVSLFSSSYLLTDRPVSDMLKIDIEYAEFTAITSFKKAYGSQEFPIGQMLIELHLFEYQHITEHEFLEWWESLEDRGMRPAWTEPNLLAVTMKLEDGNPRLAEVSLAEIGCCCESEKLTSDIVFAD